VADPELTGHDGWQHQPLQIDDPEVSKLGIAHEHGHDLGEALGHAALLSDLKASREHLCCTTIRRPRFACRARARLKSQRTQLVLLYCRSGGRSSGKGGSPAERPPAMISAR